MESKRSRLLNYQQYPPSKSCYLDGRYFNIVFGDYPGLIDNPLYISISKENELTIFLPPIKVIPSEEYFGLLRVIVTSDKIRHSLIVILDYQNEKAFIYNPDVHHPELNDMLVENISLYLSKFFDYEYFEIHGFEYMEKQKLKCKKTGVCNALVIMYALYFIEGLEFTNKNVQNVRKFMNAIESTYDLPIGNPDIEYITNSEIIGLSGGALVGGLVGSVAGPGGALIGAGVGALGGYALGSLASNNNQYSYGYDNRYGYNNGYPYNNYGYNNRYY